jgi:hypothetical protein
VRSEGLLQEYAGRCFETRARHRIFGHAMKLYRKAKIPFTLHLSGTPVIAARAGRKKGFRCRTRHGFTGVYVIPLLASSPAWERPSTATNPSSMGGNPVISAGLCVAMREKSAAA